jgi:hypothetical protein
MAKEGADTNTGTISNLLGCRDEHALFLQGEHGINKGQSTALASKPPSVYFAIAL